MNTLKTKFFGELTLPEDCVLHFDCGIPGFEGHTSFVAIEQPLARPLVYLQSLSRADLCFLTAPARAIDPTYQLRTQPDDLHSLGLGEQPEIGRDAACLVILCVNKDQSITANLMSPIVINLRTRKAAQAIQADASYSHRYCLEHREMACL